MSAKRNGRHLLKVRYTRSKNGGTRTEVRKGAQRSVVRWGLVAGNREGGHHGRLARERGRGGGITQDTNPLIVCADLPMLCTVQAVPCKIREIRLISKKKSASLRRILWDLACTATPCCRPTRHLNLTPNNLPRSPPHTEYDLTLSEAPKIRSQQFVALQRALSQI